MAQGSWDNVFQGTEQEGRLFYRKLSVGKCALMKQVTGSEVVIQICYVAHF